MRVGYVKTSCVMTAKELGRNRFALVLLVVIPMLFFSLVSLTTSEHPVAFRLASVSEDTVVQVSARNESLLFIGVAAVGLLTSFLALNLSQRNAAVNRRLILCGFRSSELILAKLSVLLLAVLVISLYVGPLLLVFFRPRHFVNVVLGFVLAGFVHLCYGLLVGTTVKREPEGILLIVLLVNIDAGWLQNPVYYAEAQNKLLIRRLPAYFPSQASIVSAFTDHSIFSPFIGSVAYGVLLLIAALLIYWWRMRIVRPR